MSDAPDRIQRLVSALEQWADEIDSAYLHEAAQTILQLQRELAEARDELRAEAAELARLRPVAEAAMHYFDVENRLRQTTVCEGEHPAITAFELLRDVAGKARALRNTGAATGAGEKGGGDGDD